MARYEITRQEVNCGPTRTAWADTLDEANAFFDAAVRDGAIFVEIFDFDNDCQIRVEFPRCDWV